MTSLGKCPSSTLCTCCSHRLLFTAAVVPFDSAVFPPSTHHLGCNSEEHILWCSLKISFLMLWTTMNFVNYPCLQSPQKHLNIYIVWTSSKSCIHVGLFALPYFIYFFFMFFKLLSNNVIVQCQNCHGFINFELRYTCYFTFQVSNFPTTSFFPTL